MDLALLVYGISLLSGFSKFFIFIGAIAILTMIANAIYYADYGESGREVNQIGKNCISRMWKAFWLVIVSALILILIPSEKTAYTMVGAYAAQKVSENDKVQQMSGKVLTIIEQKLDGYIDEGFKEAEEKLPKSEKKSKK